MSRSVNTRASSASRALPPASEPPVLLPAAVLGRDKTLITAPSPAPSDLSLTPSEDEEDVESGGEPEPGPTLPRGHLRQRELSAIPESSSPAKEHQTPETKRRKKVEGKRPSKASSRSPLRPEDIDRYLQADHRASPGSFAPRSVANADASFNPLPYVSSKSFSAQLPGALAPGSSSRLPNASSQAPAPSGPSGPPLFPAAAAHNRVNFAPAASSCLAGGSTQGSSARARLAVPTSTGSTSLAVPSVASTASTSSSLPTAPGGPVPVTPVPGDLFAMSKSELLQILVTLQRGLGASQVAEFPPGLCPVPFMPVSSAYTAYVYVRHITLPLAVFICWPISGLASFCFR